jgi:hypothetical protein
MLPFRFVLNKISVDRVENTNARGSMNRLRLSRVHLVQDTNSAMCENAHGCDINRLRTKLVRLGLCRQDAKYSPPPIEHCPPPFLGLTTQPCGEPCGFAAGFGFLTVEVVELEKKACFLQRLNLCQCYVASSTPGRFRVSNPLNCCKT